MSLLVYMRPRNTCKLSTRYEYISVLETFFYFNPQILSRHPRESGSPKVIKCIFLKVYFWALMRKKKKTFLGIMGGQNQVKVTKCKISKVYFSVPMMRRNLDIMGGQNQVKVTQGHPMKCKFSKSVFFSSYAQKNHLWYSGSKYLHSTHCIYMY